MHLKPIPAREIKIILGMIVVVAIPVFLTHATVRVPVTQITTTDNPTPYGYTVSLLLFLLPVLAIALWHIKHGNQFDKRAFLWCAVLMATLGAFLDFFFGYAFFEFPNEGATLGIRLPAWSWGQRQWIGEYLPLEEFGFYIFGSLFMVSVYLWADLNWLARYDPDARADEDAWEDTYTKAARAHPKIIEMSPHALGVWAGLLAIGIGGRWLSDGGFPGYYVFLMGAGILPSLLLVRTVKRFVNWHALSFAFAGLVLISVIWEATLGLPYQWWTYRHDQMLGIYLHAWGGLPVEEVTLWLVGVWDAVMFYELFRILFRMDDRKVRDRWLGVRPT
jgi:hypothetical protein